MTRLAIVVLALWSPACGGSPTPAAGTPLETWIEPTTGMLFVKIEAGRFVMGSPLQEDGREAQERQHDVRIARAFWLGTCEVTREEWRRVMGDSPSRFRGDRRPVDSVTWFDVQEFLTRLTELSPSNRYRLPTEAEWEYACRAGASGPYNTGPALGTDRTNVAKSIAETAAGRGGTMRVGSFAPNGWGLYDMHGNVWEWTDDHHCPDPDGPVTDRAARCDSILKVIRGGSWYFEADSARCALRYTHRPQDRGFSLGFRVVREEASGRHNDG